MALVVCEMGRCGESPEKNLVEDPGAEGKPQPQKIRGCLFPYGWGCYNGAGTAEWGITQKEAHSGNNSVFMRITGFEETVTNNALTFGGTTAGYNGERALEAKPLTKYYFSFWIKGQGYFKPLRVFCQGWNARLDASGRQRIPTTLNSIRYRINGKGTRELL